MDLRDNVKHNNNCIMELPEGEEREQGIQNLFEEIMTKHSPNLVKQKTRKSRKRRECQTRLTQTGPLQVTSQLKWQSLKTRRES